MKFDDLDRKMRVYETLHDYFILPEIYMVARIDGRNFTRLTKEIHQFESPYDMRFRDYMVATTEHLMDCGFRVIYGYTQSDEISLLFHVNENTFGRKARKYNSILAGEASARFSLLLGDSACFDCRLSELPNSGTVIDYFRWRHEDAHRNALNAHCYWMLRKQGSTMQEATRNLSGMSVGRKNELLFQNGINYNDLPNWQKRGIGLYWDTYGKQGVNPVTGDGITSMRRKVKVDYDLPMKEEYSSFIGGLLAGQEADE
jgi:tRNA(His) 5'-end guanylyltransferase